MFTAIDGKTTGPNLFEGPIGKCINTCTSKIPAEFKAISIESSYVEILEKWMI